MLVVCHCASLMQLLTMQLLTSLSLRVSLPLPLSLLLSSLSLSLFVVLSLTHHSRCGFLSLSRPSLSLGGSRHHTLGNGRGEEGTHVRWLSSEEEGLI